MRRGESAQRSILQGVFLSVFLHSKTHRESMKALYMRRHIARLGSVHALPKPPAHISSEMFTARWSPRSSQPPSQILRLCRDAGCKKKVSTLHHQPRQGTVAVTRPRVDGVSWRWRERKIKAAHI